MPAEWNRIRNRCDTVKSFDIRVGKTNQINVYYDKYVGGKRIRGSMDCYDVRLTQGIKVNVYCDKYVKNGM